MSVFIDGSTLASLLFNHLNCQGNQYGFLLGERVEHVEDRISDSQIHTANVTSYTYISSFVPWPSHDSIYGRSGALNEAWMEKLLKEQEETLVGWYSFRYETSLRPSLKEVTLHTELTSCSRYQGDPQDLCFFVCTSSVSPNGSTHTCNHGFFYYDQGCFATLPMSIMNLGDTTRKEYRKRSIATLSHSPTFRGLFQKHSKDFERSPTEMEQVRKVEHLAGSITKSLMAMHSKVTENEVAVGAMEQDVNNLRSRLEVLEREEMEGVFEGQRRKMREKEEDNLRKEAEEEADEQGQLDRLMLELGLTNEGQQICTPLVNTTDSNVPETMSPGVATTSLPYDSYVYVNSNNSNSSSEVSRDDEWVNITARNVAPVQAKLNLKNVDQSNLDDHNQREKEVHSKDPFAFLDEELRIGKASKGTHSLGVKMKSKPGSSETSEESHNDQKETSKPVSLTGISKKTLVTKLSSPPVMNSNHAVPSVSAATVVVNGNKGIDTEMSDSDIVEVDEASYATTCAKDEMLTISSSPVF